MTRLAAVGRTRQAHYTRACNVVAESYGAERDEAIVETLQDRPALRAPEHDRRNEEHQYPGGEADHHDDGVRVPRADGLLGQSVSDVCHLVPDATEDDYR